MGEKTAVAMVNSPGGRSFVSVAAQMGFEGFLFGGFRKGDSVSEHLCFEDGDQHQVFSTEKRHKVDE
jgi:hypothetical protein